MNKLFNKFLSKKGGKPTSLVEEAETKTKTEVLEIMGLPNPLQEHIVGGIEIEEKGKILLERIKTLNDIEKYVGENLPSFHEYGYTSDGYKMYNSNNLLKGYALGEGDTRYQARYGTGPNLSLTFWENNTVEFNIQPIGNEPFDLYFKNHLEGKTKEMILNYHRYDEEQRKNITWVEGLKAMKSRQEVVQTFNQQLQEKGISLPEYEHNRYKNMEKVFQENLLQILTQG